MIVCVTDRRNPASTNKSTFVKKPEGGGRKKRRRSIVFESYELYATFNCVGGNI